MGNHFRTHQVVKELIRFIFVFRIGRHGEDIKEGQRPLFRNEVGDIHAVFRLFRTVSRLPDVPFLDAPEEIFATVLNYLGKDPNSNKADDYTGPATDLLLKLRPNIRYFPALTLSTL